MIKVFGILVKCGLNSDIYLCCELCLGHREENARGTERPNDIFFRCLMEELLSRLRKVSLIEKFQKLGDANYVLYPFQELHHFESEAFINLLSLICI